MGKVLAGSAAVLLVLAAVTVWAVLDRDDPGPASVDQALDRFEQDGDDGGTTTAVRPPDGVYLYEGEGVERLSFPPLTQRDGGEMPATVTHEPDGCWTFRLDFNVSHWQSWTYCPVDGGMAEVAGANGQEWDLGVSTVGNRSEFTCDPPNPVLVGQEPGDRVHHRCTGTNSAIDGETVSAGTLTFVGPETLTIGGEEVEALHYVNQRRLQGSQNGPERTEAWYRADGLLLRYERDIEVATASPVGDITYTETGELVLTTLEPRR